MEFEIGVATNLGGLSRLPETGFVRLSQVLQFIPVGKTCWWEGVKSGRFPPPVKLTERCTAWRAEDIRQLIAHISDRRSVGLPEASFSAKKIETAPFFKVRAGRGNFGGR